MNMIIQVRRVALITLSKKVLRLSVPLHHASSSGPETPQAAHSVAVAKPSTSEKNTARISSRHGMSLVDSESFLRNGIGGSRGGIFLGLSSDHTMMYPEYSAITRKPGKKPPRKTCKTDTFAVTA